MISIVGPHPELDGFGSNVDGIMESHSDYGYDSSNDDGGDSSDDNIFGNSSENDSSNSEQQVQSQPLESFQDKSRIQKTVREQFTDFLSIPVQPFKASRQGTLSTGTRKPTFFDLHLHPDLQLRRIVVVKDLPQRIARGCDELTSARNMLCLKAFTRFPFSQVDTDHAAHISQHRALKNEAALASSHHYRFGAPLSTVTSTLVFQHSKWKSVFDYSLHDHSRDSAPDLNFAKPDGFLFVVGEKRETSVEELKLVHKKDMDDIKLILKHNLNCLALWEFKSLAAGSKKTMIQFTQLKGDFTWSTCQGTGSCSRPGKHDTNGQLLATGRKIGYDATDSLSFVLGKFPAVGESAAKEPGDCGKTESEYSDIPMSMEIDQAAPSGSEMIPTKSLTATASTRMASTLTKMSTLPKGLALKKSSSVTGSRLWAEGVKHDTTFLVLNSGNYEIIGFRHRETQTLYISPVFKVVDADYKRVQIGLHALAYYDARNRAHQLEALEKPGSRVSAPLFHNLTLHVEAYRPFNQPANTPAVVIDSDTIYMDLLKQLESNDTIKVKLSKRGNYGTWEWERDQSRSSHLPPALSELRWTMALGQKISNQVYSVTIQDDLNHSFSNKLVIKLAQNSSENAALDYEYKCHVDYFKKGFGIKAFGILCIPNQKFMRGLLMEWSGDSLDRVKDRKKVLKKHKQKFIDALKMLHECGKVHGNLKKDHVLLTKDGHVSFIAYKQFDASPKEEMTIITSFDATKPL